MFITPKLRTVVVAFLFVGVLVALPAVAQQGRVLGVVKVLPDDVLYVRSAASGSASIVGALPFDATGVAASGETRVVGKTTWVEVSYGGFTGWASRSYLDQVAASRNVTSEWAKRLGSASSAAALAERLQGHLQETVAHSESSSAGAQLVGITKTSPPRAVVLVTGYMDDSVSGEQFVLTMRQDGGNYTVDTIRSSSICWRGVSGSLCI